MTEFGLRMLRILKWSRVISPSDDRENEAAFRQKRPLIWKLEHQKYMTYIYEVFIYKHVFAF